MKDALNKLLDLLALAVCIGLAVLIIALGYFIMSLALNFGWSAVFGLLAIVAIVGVIEGTLKAIILAPVTLAKAVIKSRKPDPAPTPQDMKNSKLAFYTIGLLLVCGAIVAVLQFLIQGPLV